MLSLALDKGTLSCCETGNGPVETRVFVCGESWAGGGRLLPHLAHAAADRLGGSVRVCTLGFSGQNTKKILLKDLVAYANESLGGPPDNVVFLNGVNDFIQRRGAKAYAAGTKKLLDLFPKASCQAVELPIVLGRPKLPIIHSLRFRARELFSSSDRRDYVCELRKRVPADQLIPFEPFSTGYIYDKFIYAMDQIHLTLEGYARYGAYIGGRLNMARQIE